jgi:membrane protein
MARTPDEIRRDIERTRARFSERVDAIVDKVTPPRPDRTIRDKAAEAAATAKDKLEDAVGSVREHATRHRHSAGDSDNSGDPDPDDPRKPDDPPELRGPAWKYVFKRAIREFGRLQATDMAATLTYYAVLSVFPALLAIFSLLGVIGQGRSTAEAVLAIVRGFAPSSTVELIRNPIMQFATSGAAGYGVAIGIVGAAWTASGYVGAFSRAMNRIYGVREGRPVWILRPVQLAITLVVIVLISLIALLLVVSGPVTDAIGAWLNLGSTVTTVWDFGKWPVLAAAAIAVIALLYWGSPNVRQPRIRWISPGSILALLVLAIATLGFGFYVANFSNYNKSYGSLAGVIIFLVWLWIANLVVLFGAFFDAELERGRELQGGIDAADGIRLPMRDERQVDKQRAKYEDLVDQARTLRRHRAR